MRPAAIALHRFGLGPRPDEPVPADPHGWLLAQLERYQPLPPAWATALHGPGQAAQWLEAQRTARQSAQAQAQDAQQRLVALQALRRETRDHYVEAVAARTASALQSDTPFVERLVHFWANHFAVSVEKPAVLALAGAFEADAIRPHVLGRFEDMLLAVERHPAMLLYLDQAVSVGPGSPAGLRSAERGTGRPRGLNENLAREILELHTLGVRSGYGQADVTEFARALTGWSVAGGPGPAPADGGASGFQFRPQVHEPGARTLLSRGYAQPGEAQALAILHDLAVAPATANHIAAKLARHFAGDDPPPALVRSLAEAFLRGGGDLPTVYRALVDAPAPWEPARAKFKSPWDWAVSAGRGLGRRELPGPQVAGLMNQLGQPVWRPGSPAGWDDAGASWAAPDALLRRVEAAQRIASQVGDALDARTLAERLLPGALGDSTRAAIARADSPGSALALLLVAPEFLRR